MKTAKQPRVRLNRAINALGTRKDLAGFLGISPEAIMNWQREKKRYLPPLRAYQVLAVYPELDDRR